MFGTVVNHWIFAYEDWFKFTGFMCLCTQQLVVWWTGDVNALIPLASSHDKIGCSHKHTFITAHLFNTSLLLRLKYICKNEGFKTSSIALSALAEYTGTISLASSKWHIFTLKENWQIFWTLVVQWINRIHNSLT